MASGAAMRVIPVQHVVYFDPCKPQPLNRLAVKPVGEKAVIRLFKAFGDVYEETSVATFAREMSGMYSGEFERLEVPQPGLGVIGSIIDVEVEG